MVERHNGDVSLTLQAELLGLNRTGLYYQPMPPSAEEIANLFVFLCSDRASYCVGSAFFADGGMLRTI